MQKTNEQTGEIIALYLLWVQNIIMALIMVFVPPIIVSFAITQLSDLEKYKQSSSGKYMQKYMTRRMEILRFIGYAIMAIGAWYHISNQVIEEKS
ncbi:Uncharacterised protein [uncultured archaeon]|nr:Uncharacterised protein [uncultured archaeon]